MSAPAPSVGPIIEVDALTKRFGQFTAVDSVSFEVARGEIFGYLGANGAGKTTTIRMLCGLLAPTGGRALVAGHDVGTRPRDVKRSIGYMSQRFSLYLDLTVEENLAFFSGAYGMYGARRAARIAWALEHAGLGDRRATLTRSLPGGIRQRLALASALLHEPALVFLDEPTAGVDPASRRDFWRIIRQIVRAGTTVFVTTHHLDEAEYCDRVGLMVDGALVALDTPPGLKATHVPGQVWAVEGATREQVTAALRGPDVRAIQVFGRQIHVRVTGALAQRDGFEAALRAAGLGALRVEESQATLEDVFLELVGRGRGGQGEGAAA
ncbi:MAG: multidrug ABC transporter ATP-binding protein [Deltaproteobacteria bacterium HGW-Deltaproteobacteria-14]|jgi:ABC-2 type transport system ATP-binding protein|nr:MAG: multidrug ABC transporter ATP-binding protein [Deltaproteobacteria bacterium HGW-Deltaproteobacteria-14]